MPTAALLDLCLVIALGLPRPVNALLPESIARHTEGFGSEFMPTLEEGSLLFMPVLLPATALTEVSRILAWQDQVIRRQHRFTHQAPGKIIATHAPQSCSRKMPFVLHGRTSSSSSYVLIPNFRELSFIHVL